MLEAYKGKRVLVTGHTGFKGSWLSLWLSLLGAKVIGCALPPATSPSLFEILGLDALCLHNFYIDITDLDALTAVMRKQNPEIIFHLAAQPLVRSSYDEPVKTYLTNVMGTLHVLEAAKACDSVQAVVNVTTDKCYENTETESGYTETSPLGGHDMYSSSKACSELLSSSYRRSYLSESGFALATARAGNVIGGGDWAADRLVPDCIRAWVAGTPFTVRNPEAIRPWLYVLDPLHGYLLLGEKLIREGRAFAQAFNFGPRDRLFRVGDIVSKLAESCPGMSLSFPDTHGPHEAGTLVLDAGKAQKELNWEPKYTTFEAITDTMAWYTHYYASKPMREFTIQQIEDYCRKAC